MKKVITMVLSLCMMFSLSACGSQEPTESSSQGSAVMATDKAEETPAQESSETVAGDTEETKGGKTLVVYFSNTGKTKAIAEKIADGVEAELFEIIPKDPYTEADLDYGDDDSRSTKEMNDSSVRPEIEGSVENMDQYDTVYIGYPIWWGEAPRVLETFVESCDFSDKTVIPFCTSGGSGIGSSADTLESGAGAGKWLEGKRFSGNESASAVMDWVNQMK